MPSVGDYYLTITPSFEKGSFNKLGSEITGSVNGKSVGKKFGDDMSSGAKGGLSTLKVAIGSMLGNLASNALQAGIDKVMELGSAAIEASDATDKFKTTLDFAGLGTEQIDALTASCKKYADETVYDLSDIQSITAQLASNNVADFDKLAEAAGNLNAVAGGNKDTFKSVGMVLTQTAGQGKLTTENFNQLADAIPGASGKIQQELSNMGAYTGNFRDAMAKGEISAEEFNQAILNLGFTDAAQEAATSTSTMEGAMGNLEAAITGDLMAAFDLVKPYVTEFIGFLADGIAGLPELFTQIGTALQPVGEVIITVAQGILDGLGGLFTWLSETFGPFFMNILVPAMTEAWTAINECITAAVDLLGPIIMGFIEFIQPLWDGFWGAVGSIVSAVWSGIQTAVSTVLDVIIGIIDAFTALFQGDWQGFWDAIKNIVQSVWDGITSLVGTAIDAVKGVVDNVLGALKGLWDNAWNGLKDVVGRAWEGIKNGVKQGIENVVNFVRDLPGKITSALGNLGNLLLDAGKSVINGFLDGLKSAWDAVTGWIGGIGDWIASHKGPLDYDRRLLIPHGKAVMEGFYKGLSEGYGDVQGLVKGMGMGISVTAGAGAVAGATTMTTSTVNYYVTIDGTSVASDERFAESLAGLIARHTSMGRV